MLGLALDLDLRSKGLNLDDFMKQVWNTYGKSEVSYTIEDLHLTLDKYAGTVIADKFFGEYIYKSEMPKYADLFKSVGLKLTQDDDKGYFGASLKANETALEISSNPKISSPAYIANLNSGDIITAVNGDPISSMKDWEKIMNESKPGTVLEISYTRHTKQGEAKVTLSKDPTYLISMDENADEKAKKARAIWLSTK
jgi:predicted metalloprotease with PDZ domain